MLLQRQSSLRLITPGDCQGIRPAGGRSGQPRDLQEPVAQAWRTAIGVAHGLAGRIYPARAGIDQGEVVGRGRAAVAKVACQAEQHSGVAVSTGVIQRHGCAHGHHGDGRIALGRRQGALPDLLDARLVRDQRIDGAQPVRGCDGEQLGTDLATVQEYRELVLDDVGEGDRVIALSCVEHLLNDRNGGLLGRRGQRLHVLLHQGEQFVEVDVRPANLTAAQTGDRLVEAVRQGPQRGKHHEASPSR